jgi:hypothetical protein
MVSFSERQATDENNPEYSSAAHISGVFKLYLPYPVPAVHPTTTTITTTTTTTKQGSNESQSYLTTDGQSVRLPWYQATIWYPQPNLPRVAVAEQQPESTHSNSNR